MADTPFDPRPHMRELKGSPYLDVRWRLVWLRSEHPDAQISTDLVEYSAQLAIFKATVTLPSGGSATGYGSESLDDFRDYVEKAETKAIGRALLALGYGQPELDDPAPVQAQAAPSTAQAATLPAGEMQATVRQIKYLCAVAAENGVDPEQASMQRWKTPLRQLTRRQASDLIDWVQGAPDSGN